MVMILLMSARAVAARWQELVDPVSPRDDGDHDDDPQHLDIVSSADDIAVVGETDDGVGAVVAVRKHRPDVVLMDIRMPRMDGITATAALRALDPAPQVVVLTTFQADEHVVAALRAGASGFLVDETPSAVPS